MCTAGDLYSGQCSDGSNPVQKAYTDWISESSVTNACRGARSSWDLLTVYAAILGTEEAQMAEEAGTNTVSKRGHETWDNTKTGVNEVNLWFEDDEKKATVTSAMDKILCAGKSQEQTFLQ